MMNAEVVQNLLILVGYGVGVIALIGLLIYIHRVSRNVQDIQDEIDIIDTAHEKATTINPDLAETKEKSTNGKKGIL